MVTEISAARWRVLMETAVAVGESAPWTWLDDGQLLGVVDPASGEKAYCSIMGRESNFKALAIYPGRVGWWSYLQISQEEADADSQEILYKQRCVVLSFEAQPDSDDLALLRHLGLDEMVGDMTPSFRSYKPGYVPAAPDAQEIEWLLLVLPQVLTAAQEVYAGLHLIPENGLNKEGQMLFRVGNGEAWRSEWLKPDPNADFSPAQIALAPDEALAGRALPQTEVIWLVEDFYLPEPADGDDGGKAFFPRALILFDLEEQCFRGLTLMHPEDWPGGAGSSLLEMLMNAGHRPAQLVASHRETFILVKPFCQALEIGVHLDTAIDIRSELREAVLEMWQES